MSSSWHRFILPILSKFRRRRGQLILKKFPSLASMRVLDLGGSIHFWFESGLIGHVKQVVIYNISVAEIDISHKSSDKITFQLYDGLKLPVEDSSFDLVLSNSVLEHIPPASRGTVAKEIMRVGRRGFIQTPAAEFPVEPHFVLPFVHWVPRALGRQLVRLSPWALMNRPTKEARNAYFDEVRLLSYGDIRRLFPRRKIEAETFLLFPKSWLVSW